MSGYTILGGGVIVGGISSFSGVGITGSPSGMNSFWDSFSFSTINDILNKPSFTLEELLDEDDVVSDVRNGKHELVSYLCQCESIEKMLHYLLDDDENATSNQKFRYPVVVCEIFCASSPQIEEVLVSSSDTRSPYLERIYSFYSSRPLNLLKANIIGRLASHLLQAKTRQTLFFLRNNPTYLFNLVCHVEAASVPNYLIRLINVEFEEEGRGTLQWLVEIGFPTLFVDLFGPEYGGVHSDAVICFLDVLGAVPFESVLSRTLYDAEHCSRLVQHIVSKENPSALRYGVKVLIQLVKSVGNACALKSEEENSCLTNLPPAIYVSLQALPQFKEILSVPSSPGAGEGEGEGEGGESGSFTMGWGRIHIIRLLETLLLLDISIVRRTLLSSGIWDPLLLLMFTFPNCNLGHSAIESLFSKVWGVCEGDEKVKLIENTNLVERLVTTEDDENLQFQQTAQQTFFPTDNTQMTTTTSVTLTTSTIMNTNPNLYHKSYLPYLRRIGVSLLQATEDDPVLKGVVEQYNGWYRYYETIKELLNQQPSLSGNRFRGRFINDLSFPLL